MSVGLRARRGVLQQRRSQIAEPRHCNHSESAVHKRASDRHPLIEAAAGPVDDEQRRAFSRFRVFDRSACGPHDPADAVQSLLRSAQIAPEGDVHPEARHERGKRQEKEDR